MKNITIENNNHLPWLSILRGWAVLLVVIFHAPLNDQPGFIGIFFDGFNTLMHFRMPLFFFISGFLLYHTKLKYNSPYSNIWKKRITRVAYPYIFLCTVIYLLKLIFASYVKRPVDLSLFSYFEMFLYPRHNLPWGPFWFLNTILIFFILYPLIKVSLKKWYGIVMAVIISLTLRFFVPDVDMLFDFWTVAYYFIFFYCGILFSKFNVIEYFRKNKVWVFILSLVVFLAANVFIEYFKNLGYGYDMLNPFKLIHSLSGISLSVYLSLFCAKFLPNIFSSFRKYYYQVYLFGTLCQLVVLEIYSRTSSPVLMLLLSILSVFVGIYVPVLISKIIRKINWKPLLKATGF
ncbi:MAG: acyltransferase [Bacteroidales bacterium]|jgi:peptidoglycan/LPS O-acetylase OafA/YrhL|nr:acyltransferase [Bacteroidales bacterium]